MFDQSALGEAVECLSDFDPAAAVALLEVDLLQPHAGREQAGLDVAGDPLGDVERPFPTGSLAHERSLEPAFENYLTNWRQFM
jgi:hypothetical protein